MFGKIAKFFLVLTSLAPVGFVYSYVFFLSGKTEFSVIIGILSVALVLFCLGILSASYQYLEKFSMSFTEVEAADRENIAFLLLYVSPLFTSQLGDVNIYVVVPTIVIFAVITSTGYNYHFNPLLGFLGWHFYRVCSAEGVVYVLITKRQLRNTHQIDQVGQLTEYILIDLGSKNAGQSTRDM